MPLCWSIHDQRSNFVFPNVVQKSCHSWLENKIIKTDDSISPCRKHDLAQHPTADACPCHARLYWQLDRLDESVYRLKVQKCSVSRWSAWYLRSSAKHPGFPRESVDCWTQTGQPLAAWQKYGVAQRNGQRSPEDGRAYLYCKNSREVRSRRAAASNSQ